MHDNPEQYLAVVRAFLREQDSAAKR